MQINDKMKKILLKAENEIPFNKGNFFQKIISKINIKKINKIENFIDLFTTPLHSSSSHV